MKFKSILLVFVFLGVISGTSQTHATAVKATGAVTAAVTAVPTTTCTDSGRIFYGGITVNSYASNSTSVCTGQVTSVDGLSAPQSGGAYQSEAGTNYSIEFEPENDSSYSSIAINASLQTACKMLEEGESLNLELSVSGDIYDCSILGRATNSKIKADSVYIGDVDFYEFDYTNAFVGLTRGDAVSETDSSVVYYRVSSDTARLQCSASFLSSGEEDYSGSTTALSSSGRVILSEQTRYDAAVARCNTLLDAYLNNLTVDITGEIYGGTTDSDDINAYVTITKVE